MNGLPDIMTSAQLCARLQDNGGRMNRQTLWQLSQNDLRWSACVIRRTKRSTTWSTQRLISAGILFQQAPVAEQPIAGPGFTFSTQGVG